jgi:hypothetical protein
MSKFPGQARSPKVGEQDVLGLFHLFRLLFHAASTLPLDCAVDAASALPRSDRVAQPWSFAAVYAMARPWYQAPARERMRRMPSSDAGHIPRFTPCERRPTSREAARP